MDEVRFDGQKLRDARKKAHLSQEELGFKVGIRRQTIAGYEAGEALPDANILSTLAFHLGVDVRHLYTTANPPSTLSPEGESKKQKPRPVMKDRHKHSKVA